MGLLGNILFGNSFGTGGKTKADWDREIMRLNDQLATAKANLAQRKEDKKRMQGRMNFDGAIATLTDRVEDLKSQIANAKIQRRNAPN